LLCLGAIQTAKADTLIYNASISYAGTNPTTSYYNNAASVVEQVTISNIGGSGGVGIQVGTYPSSVPGTGDVYYCTNCIASQALPTTSPFFLYLPSDSTGLVIGGTASSPIISDPSAGSYSGTYDQICILGSQTGGAYPNNSCNTNQGTTNVSYAAGLVTVTNQSLGLSFTLTPVSTPEASSLLTLGSGLLGLLGFGFKRKSIV